MLDNEQRDLILDFSAESPSESAIVTAFAGTGKTSTLVEVGKRNPERTYLYVPFSKPAQLDAERRMPRNVICRTFNSIGWEVEEISKRFGFDGVAGGFRTPPNQMIKRLRLENDTDLTVVKATLRLYMNSVEQEIGWNHVPREALLRFPREERSAYAREIIRATKLLWSLMLDPKCREFPLIHDAYMKQWLLDGGKLPYVEGEVEALFLDEAQDLNPVNWALAQSWGLPTFVVGDSYQQIYAWRGAVDALKRFDTSNASLVRQIMKFWLSRSYRFGGALPELANAILRVDPLDCPNVLLEGAGFETEVLPAGSSVKGQHTILCRTNFGLMEAALASLRAGKTIAIVGDLKDAIGRMSSAWALCNGDMKGVKHPDIKIYGEWEALVEAAKDDQDLTITVQRINQYGASIPRICAELASSVSVPEDKADVVISTAHKSKGREWDTVVLAEDFKELVKVEKDEFKVNREERNLLYVAATRARKTLVKNAACAFPLMQARMAA